MSTDGTTDLAAPNLNLTPEEKHVYGQLFRQADNDNVGVVTGEVAVKFFEKTRLDSRILGEIWQIADNENRGFLTPAGFGIVLRLIGHCQAGREPTAELALQQGPLPRFEGISPTNLTPAAPPSAAPALQSQTTGGPIRIPPLTPEKVAQYASLFERQNLQGGGLLAGDQAKQIFEKSGMPNEVLGRIWQLADTEQRGALVMTEFVIAMHLLTSMKTGTLRGLPNILPAALYEAATRRSAAPRQSPTGTGPLSAIPRQLSGSVPIRTGSPLGRPPITAHSTGAPTSTGDWLVTPADKARFDQLYNDLDKSQKGFITGEEAVPFLSQSNLPEDVLAQIWDLADFRSEGRLDKDTFAVAMYLIRQQRSSQDGSKALPASLPPNLIPPGMRNLARPPPVASPFDAPPPSQPPAPVPSAPKSALDDLFGLDSSPSPPQTAQMQTALSTGGSNANDPFATGTSVLTPSSPGRPSPTTTQFKPFMPSSSFGRGLTAHATGDSGGAAGGRAKPSAPASASEDLLGDNDPEISKKLTNETAELANLSNQVGSLSKQMQDVQGQRTSTQNELNQASAQKKNFEQRLSQLRALYEKEASDVQSLREQLAVTQNEIKKLQGESMTLDGTYRDLQTQRQQVLSSLQADQQENANLKEKIRATNAEIAQLKPQIDKLRSEARQQKGLVAINKKQLATNEAERDKLQTELADLAKSNEDLSRHGNTGSPVSTAAQVASPTPSTGSGNNPFFRRTGSTDIMGAFASPSIKPFSDKSFDDVFGPGPSAPASTGTPPPPLTSFKAQTTGTSTGSVGSFATPPATSPTISRQATLAAEPPAPPVSRQISSSFLPFATTSESLSSSRQVSPPASHVGITEPTPLEAQPSGSSFTGDALAIRNNVPSSGAEQEHLQEAPREDGRLLWSSVPAAEEEGKTAPAAASGSVDLSSFAAMDQSKAKADFDNAFASFKNSHKGQDHSKTGATSGSTAFDSEFPPISELERDEDSDSASEQGFEDDFAPASPPSKKAETPAEAAMPSTRTAQSHPDAHVSSANGTAAFTAQPIPQSDVTASPTATFPVSPPTSTQTHDIFGSALPDPASNPSGVPATTTTTTTTTTTVSAQAGKTPFDDLDDEFEGLEDAKEGSADDDFQTISRSGLDDFNPVFDSSPSHSQAKSESTAFGAESSYDFGTVSTTSAAAAVGGADSAVSGTTQQQSAAAPDPHDWDAIFASLDSPANSATTVTSPQSKDARPAPPGRVMSAEGENDDPILKNLTSMGYSRSDALLALEKYDYNLERAANYLASQS